MAFLLPKGILAYMVNGRLDLVLQVKGSGGTVHGSFFVILPVIDCQFCPTRPAGRQMGSWKESSDIAMNSSILQ